MKLSRDLTRDLVNARDDGTTETGVSPPEVRKALADNPGLLWAEHPDSRRGEGLLFWGPLAGKMDRIALGSGKMHGPEVAPEWWPL